MGWRRLIALTVAGVTAAVLLGAATLTGFSPTAGHVGLLVAALVLGATPVLAGLLVVRADQGGTLGPLLTVPGLVAALAITGQLAQSADSSHHPWGAAYVTAASQGAWVLIYVAVAVLVLFFPDGRLSGRGDRCLLAAIVTVAAVFIAVAATAPGPFMPPDQSSPHVFGTMPAVLANVLTAICLPALVATLVLLVVRLVRRYRAADAGRRRQFKWLALAAAILPATLLATWLSYAVAGQADVVLAVGFAAMYLAVPVVIALAVLRPDLFDVDRVLASAAAHAALTTVLLLVFTIVNLTVGLVAARASPVVAVTATALCAIALFPLRARLQSGVDRWLYPARKAAFAAIDRLHHDTVAGRARAEQLQAVLQDALRDPQLHVAYLVPATAEMVDADGVPLDDGHVATMTPVQLGADQIGAMRAGQRTSPELLRDIAAHAAPLVEVVRLRVELRSALRQIEASRARLLRVGYEERVRLERDLHDGAQQRLVSLGIALRLAQRRLPRGDADMSGVLDEAVAELGTALGELRHIAHGIRPACLDDGLGPALAGLARSAPIPVSVHMQAAGLDDNIEITAYYVAAEAITNALKHAHARHIELEVDAGDSSLCVRVTDDGAGGALPHDGSGLSGLADRVGAYGGTLAITSPHGGGTTIEAILPCASS